MTKLHNPIWVVTFISVLLGSSMFQLASAQSDSEIPTGKLSGQPFQALETGDVIYLKDDQGELHPVPVDKTFEDWVKFLDRSDTQSNLPRIIPQDLFLEGQILESQDSGSWLDFHLSLQLSSRGDGWESFALGCQQAIITDIQPPNSDRVIIDRDPDSQNWRIWLRENQTVNLHLKGRVRLQSNGNRSTVQLALPRAIRSVARIRLPQTKLQVIAIEGLISQQQESDKQTIVDLIGLTQSLDLEWEKIADARSALESTVVKSTILVDVRDNKIITSAKQSITPQSSLRQLTVKLPFGFELESVESEGLLNQTIDPAKPGQIILEYKDPFRTEKIIQWQVSAELRRNQDQIAISGFDVVGSKSQAGEIGLAESPVWQLKIIDSRSRGVTRMNVSETKRAEKLTSSYQYEQQPFRMTVQVLAVKPGYTAKADYQIDVDESTNNVELQSVFTVSLTQGQLLELPIHWAEIGEKQWVVTSVNLNQSPTSTRWRRTESGLTIPLSEETVFPLTVEIRAQTAREDVTQDVQLSVPVPIGTLNAVQGQLALKDAGPIQSQLTFSQPDEWKEIQRNETIDGSTLIHNKVYQFRSLANPQLTLTTQKQSQKRSAKSTLTVETTQVDENEILISQKIHLKAEYVPLGDLTFQLSPRIQFPPKYGARVGVRSSTGKLLFGSSEQATSSDPPTLTIRPNQWSSNQNDRWETEFTFQYIVALDQIVNQTTSLYQLPLVTMEGIAFESTTFLQSLQKSWEVSSNQWRRQFDDPVQTSWISYKAVNAIPLKRLRAGEIKSVLRPLASNAQLTVLKYPNGQWLCQLDCRFQETPQELLIRWPAQISQVSSQWNSNTQSDQQYTWLSEEFRDTGLKLKPPTSFNASDSASLVLRWIVPKVESSFLNRIRKPEQVLMPEFEGIWWQSLKCTLQLPQGQVLASTSHSTHPIDQWSLRGWYWSRSVSATDLKKQPEWRPSELINQSGRVYRFQLNELPASLNLMTQSITAMTLAGLAIGLLTITGFSYLWDQFNRLAVVTAGLCCLLVGCLLPETLSQWGQPLFVGLAIGCWLEWLRSHKVGQSHVSPAVVVIDHSDSIVNLSQINEQSAYTSGIDSITTIRPVMQATSSVISSEDDS